MYRPCTDRVASLHSRCAGATTRVCIDDSAAWSHTRPRPIHARQHATNRGVHELQDHEPANASLFNLAENLTGPRADAFQQCKDRPDARYACLRVSYSFVQDTFDLVHRELPLLADKVAGSTVVLLAGKWDLYWFSSHWGRTHLTGPYTHRWYEDNNLDRWSVAAAEPAYRALYDTLNRYCTRPLGYVLFEVGYASFHAPVADEYVMMIRRIVRGMSALRTLLRWNTTMARRADHMARALHR